jgi:hypothetical protein
MEKITLKEEDIHYPVLKSREGILIGKIRKILLRGRKFGKGVCIAVYTKNKMTDIYNNVEGVLTESGKRKMLTHFAKEVL